MQDGKAMKAHLKQVVKTCSGILLFLLMGRCVGVGTLLLGMNVDVMNTISVWEWTIIRVIVGWALRVWGKKLVGGGYCCCGNIRGWGDINKGWWGLGI